MGGSNNFKTVNNYSALAKYYDSLLEDPEALFLWLDYINEYTKGKDILELASGSGLMAKLLNDNGYNVIASDISDEMKEVASKNFDGQYLKLDMTNFKLDTKYDLVLCMLDSVNYLDGYDSLDSMFKCVCNHLKDNGVFIFDMHHDKRLEEFVQEYIEEGYVEGIPYQWTIQSDIEACALYEHFAFYEEDGIVNENHTQMVFDKTKVVELLKINGFKVTLIDDFIEDEKILIIGEK